MNWPWAIAVWAGMILAYLYGFREGRKAGEFDGIEIARRRREIEREHAALAQRLYEESLKDFEQEHGK